MRQEKKREGEDRKKDECDRVSEPKTHAPQFTVQARLRNALDGGERKLEITLVLVDSTFSWKNVVLLTSDLSPVTSCTASCHLAYPSLKTIELRIRLTPISPPSSEATDPIEQTRKVQHMLSKISASFLSF